MARKPGGMACLWMVGGLLGLTAAIPWGGMAAAADQAGAKKTDAYRVLKPIESGELVLYPIARNTASEAAAQWRYLTLDEGLKSGQVVIEEAGKARGLVRSRGRDGGLAMEPGGDEVNTLVLENRSHLPLLLLAGEIVTGGKQDRVIGKDRIVQADSAPLDLSVFCIEPGRWTEKTAVFQSAGKDAPMSFMVEPSVRSQAMVEQDQELVWSAVAQSIAAERAVTAPPARPVGPVVDGEGNVRDGGVNVGPVPTVIFRGMPATTSYAQAMASPEAVKQVDAAAEAALGEGDATVQRLLKERAVGAVAAIHGHIVWADVFATPELLAAYWTKLVRSYAAEAVHSSAEQGPAASAEAALRFVEEPVEGRETSEGSSTVYRYTEIRGREESLFLLDSLIPGAQFEVHRTKAFQKQTGPAPIEPVIY